jgi:nucleotide-binding universal stress UspA family protein
VVADQRESSAGRIVVGLDGSAGSLRALRWAGRISDAIDVRIDVLACWQFPHVGSDDLPIPAYRHDVDVEHSATQAIDEIFGDRRPEGLRILVRQGPPEQVLTAAGVGAEMLVVGSRGRGSFASVVLGSVSIHCAEHATCPVVIIHG